MRFYRAAITTRVLHLAARTHGEPPAGPPVRSTCPLRCRATHSGPGNGSSKTPRARGQGAEAFGNIRTSTEPLKRRAVIVRLLSHVPPVWIPIKEYLSFQPRTYRSSSPANALNDFRTGAAASRARGIQTRRTTRELAAPGVRGSYRHFDHALTMRLGDSPETQESEISCAVESPARSRPSEPLPAWPT